MPTEAMVSPHPLQVPAALLLLATTSAARDTLSPIDDNDCGCFKTNDSSDAYFANHLFLDFRSLSDYAGVPPLVQHDKTSSSQVTSAYFSSDEWTRNWAIQSWNNSATLGTSSSDATVPMFNSPRNIYIEGEAGSDKSHLTLRTSRSASSQSSAEFESVVSNYQHLSIRMYARTQGSPGACTAVFTYRDVETSLADVQEADIEFLTSGPTNLVQYTNQPSFTAEGETVEGASRNASLPQDLTWDDWAVHRLDWTPGKTTWYVDGEEIWANGFQAPRDPARVLFNAWSDGGSWSALFAALMLEIWLGRPSS
ncbi:concanavalin A-like lectin/glucanase domain-containing protein [Plectosphaerella plurivora]|uniref:Concanavalin A-like lectin/glucanase domain-containing protein n=1 Tax=Plectosphaerella plurivora TaxID=936078 RepID=A0A9P8VBD1_9PEZI|nr:concanavalin A-like lectin/glucanase domain-containing protein [Plectosphaerella plurivora]